MIGVYPFPEQNQVIIAYHVMAEGEIRMGEELAEVKSVAPEKGRPWPFGWDMLSRIGWKKPQRIKVKRSDDRAWT